MQKQYHFTVSGDIPSKKNSYRAGLNMGILTYIKELMISGEKPTIKKLVKFLRVRPSKTYSLWEEKVVKNLIGQTNVNLYMGKVKILFTIYFPKRSRAGGDLDNKTTSILDTIVKAGIIMDDSYNCLTSFQTEGVYRKGRGGAKFTIIDMTKD